MTIPNPANAPLLLTDADVLERVEQLVGPAAGDRQWAAALREACDRTGAALRGVYLSTSGGVHHLWSGADCVRDGSRSDPGPPFRRP
ncbi:hypothetical protein [Pseudonocardia sp. DLS-67]